jgi:hypothetical protein
MTKAHTEADSLIRNVLVYTHEAMPSCNSEVTRHLGWTVPNAALRTRSLPTTTSFKLGSTVTLSWNTDNRGELKGEIFQLYLS